MGKRKASAVEEQEAAPEDALNVSTISESGDTAVDPAADYANKVKNVNSIAVPLASRKLTKKLLKTVKKAAKSKHLKRGVKEVVKALRKNEKGLVVIAGDISPIDVITHVPVLCEDAEVPYVYVPSKEDLGLAGATKRPTSVVMISPKNYAEYTENYTEINAEVIALSVS